MFTLPPPGSKGEDGNKREAIREILDQMLDLCDERPKGTCWPLKVCCTGVVSAGPGFCGSKGAGGI